ncbi:hypothetical protein [Telmatospirillum sp.]|uniref:hypothetical protein n=1 Tax=Telmatospirillum sp. TaxID=2079197 RepID=UPI00283AF5A6|nr:hypothetical protein [Telmatospirillum sp.]MDR3439163.1 hypothetical protein [Telmatospirillum sp.]
MTKPQAFKSRNKWSSLSGSKMRASACDASAWFIAVTRSWARNWPNRDFSPGADPVHPRVGGKWLGLFVFAGNPHVRFLRGGRNQRSSLPDLIRQSTAAWANGII